MIVFKARIEVIAEDADKCHPDCKGQYCNHDGDMLCHYFDDNIEFVDGMEQGRCKACKEEEIRAKMRN